MQLLDRPVWASLTGSHAVFSQGGPLAKRYAPDVNLFAATSDESPAALQALRELIPVGAQAFMVGAGAALAPPGFRVLKSAKCVQMIAKRRCAGEDNHEIELLTEADVGEMLALARLAEPGPFLERTHAMGRFVGVRIEGRLAAMAGERFRFAGYTEVSGVCTHPDFRGRGLARSLSRAVAGGIEARGDQPFLHSWASNRAAISLYESLGFEVRTEVDVAVLERHDPV